MEMKILTAVLLKDYDWSLLPDQDFRASYSPTKRPKDGLRMIFKAKGQGTDRPAACSKETLPVREV